MDSCGGGESLPDFSRLISLGRLHLETMNGLTDLSGAAMAPALEELIVASSRKLEARVQGLSHRRSSRWPSVDLTGRERPGVEDRRRRIQVRIGIGVDRAGGRVYHRELESDVGGSCIE